MAERTIARLYDSHAAAVRVVNDLEAAGVPSKDISVVSRNQDDRRDTTTVRHGDAADDAGKGAGVGAIVGGGAGLLAGIGALAIPGLGPVVAAGWLVSTLVGAAAGAAAGAATGGLIGSLTNAGVPEREAHVYAEGVRRGGSLVTVRTDDARVAEVDAIMCRNSPTDWTVRERAYRDDGWTGFNPDAPEFVSPDPVVRQDRVVRADRV